MISIVEIFGLSKQDQIDRLKGLQDKELSDNKWKNTFDKTSRSAYSIIDSFKKSEKFKKVKQS